MNELQLVYDLAIRASDVLVCIGALAFLGLVWMDDGLQKEYKMSTEQQRKMLECAAKVCGITLEREISGKKPHRLIEHESGEGRISVPWNPLANGLDTAEMCAELGIDWINSVDSVISVSAEYDCEAFLKDHDNSRLKAWMYAATMVAAKIGGFEE